MLGIDKAFLKGMLGAILGSLIVLISYTAYQDHKVLWEIVRALNQPKAGQSEAPK